MAFRCPACGFDGLEKLPWRSKTLADGIQVWRTSHEICPQCGIEFGRDDWGNGNLEQRAAIHERWRRQWQKAQRSQPRVKRTEEMT